MENTRLLEILLQKTLLNHQHIVSLFALMFLDNWLICTERKSSHSTPYYRWYYWYGVPPGEEEQTERFNFLENPFLHRHFNRVTSPSSSLLYSSSPPHNIGRHLVTSSTVCHICTTILIINEFRIMGDGCLYILKIMTHTDTTHIIMYITFVQLFAERLYGDVSSSSSSHHRLHQHVSFSCLHPSEEHFVFVPNTNAYIWKPIHIVRFSNIEREMNICCRRKMKIPSAG